MDKWKPKGPICVSCLTSHDETTTIPCCNMITPNGHSTILKNPQNLNGCNGLLKNGNHKNHLNSEHITNHHHITDHITNNHHKLGLDINGHLDTYCCHKTSSSAKVPNSNDSEAQENSCGLWSLRPQWLQRFAHKKAFLAVFCLTSVLQGMYYTYFVSVLTTIEKLYQIQSKWTGIIMSATEVGQIFGALLLTYYGGHGHRPKWIACGMLVFALASILCSTPHFLFNEAGPPRTTIENVTIATLRELRTKLCFKKFPAENNFLSPAEDVLVVSPTSKSIAYDGFIVVPSEKEMLDSFSNISIHGNNSESPSTDILLVTLENRTTFNKLIPQTATYTDQRKKCRQKNGLENKITDTVLTIFFISLLFIGIGATAVYTLGIPYIDDNVATRESPLYFGITIGVRIFGPVFGFLLGSYCTSVYVNFPFETTIMTPDDPQWIGAWWLGVFIVGAALILTTIPMISFPRKLPQPTLHHHHYHHHHHHHSRNHNNYSNHVNHRLPDSVVKSNGNANGVSCNRRQCSQSYTKCNPTKSPVKKPKIKDFPAAVKRLTKNQILLYRTASSVLHILPIAGLYTFLPKYLESQFQLTATKANIIAGLAGILVMGVGIFASGMFMRKYKPDARFVARWIALSALAYSIGMVILMWFGCPLNKYVGLNAGGVEQWTQETCNATCNCRQGEFAPICTSEKVTYLSPCLAGCTEISATAKDQYIYKDCHCLAPNITATNGFCPLECNNLVWYVITFSIFVLVHSTSEVGSMLLTLRCVDPEDKAMALGLISFAIGLFGNVPCPIIYGAAVDSACLFWEDNCGQQGACRLYDPSKFRLVFHGVTAVIMLAAFVVDAIVWYKAKSIQFSDDEGLTEGDEVVPFNVQQDSTQFESSV